ncbi:MAG TPA: hypothetical protein EYQ00_07625 [Dehalococcoidia bacterium]|nr:hypothetical protein [Dehalococcoidia bacterium]
MVNQPSSNWDLDRLNRRLAAKQKSCSPKYHALFEYLNQRDLFGIKENERFSSIELAESVTIEVSDPKLTQATTGPPIDFVKNAEFEGFDPDGEDKVDHHRPVTDHQTREQSELRRIITNIDDMHPLLAIGVFTAILILVGILLTF